MVILKKHDEINRLVIRDEDGGEWEMEKGKNFFDIEITNDWVVILSDHGFLEADIIDTFLDTLIIEIP